MKIIQVIIVLTILKSTCQQCLSANDTKAGVPIPSWHTAQLEFSFALLHSMNQITVPNANVFFSPYAVFSLISLAYFMSSQQTEMFLKRSLRLDPSQDKIDLLGFYKLQQFVRNVDSTDKYEFKITNQMYVANHIIVRDCVASIFPSQISKIDFRTNPEKARTYINQWVEEHTNNMIKNILPPETIDEATNLIFISAAYFKGKWETKFNLTETRKEVFYSSPNVQQIVNMMYVEGMYNHGVSSNLISHVLEIPYEAEHTSMYILLPPFTTHGIENTLKSLTPETFKNVINTSMKRRQVKVWLPKLKLDQTVELTKILESLGVGNLFQQNADFSVLTGKRDVSFGAGLHKAHLDVVEDGTKSEALNIFLSFRMSSSDVEEQVLFKCNRPFIFIIYDKRFQNILFTGIVRQPAFD